jgi:DNA-binding NarL/FixJ family response regulator
LGFEPDGLQVIVLNRASSTHYRFLIGEDHPLVRVGLRQFLADHFHPAAVGEAATGAAIIEAVLHQAWDLVILDIGLPDRSGLDILPDLKRLRPQVPLLVFTMYEEEQWGLALLRGGAAGYVTKTSSFDELARAIERILAGGKYVSPQLAEHIALALDGSAPHLPHETLSNREFQVMHLLASGHSVAAIARQLSLDVRTIGTFRRNILRKLHLRTTQEIVFYAIRHGLAD